MGQYREASVLLVLISAIIMVSGCSITEVGIDNPFGGGSASATPIWSWNAGTPTPAPTPTPTPAPAGSSTPGPVEKAKALVETDYENVLSVIQKMTTAFDAVNSATNGKDISKKMRELESQMSSLMYYKQLFSDRVRWYESYLQRPGPEYSGVEKKLNDINTEVQYWIDRYNSKVTFYNTVYGKDYGNVSKVY